MRVRGLTAIVLLLAGLGRGLENFVRRDRPHELGLPPRGLACDRHATRTIRFFTICTINGTAMRMGFAENHWTALLPFFALLFAVFVNSVTDEKNHNRAFRGTPEASRVLVASSNLNASLPEVVLSDCPLA